MRAARFLYTGLSKANGSMSPLHRQDTVPVSMLPWAAGGAGAAGRRAAAPTEGHDDGLLRVKNPRQGAGFRAVLNGR